MMILEKITKKLAEDKEIREQKKIARNLQARIWAIKQHNYQKAICDVIMPSIQKQFYKDTNTLMPEMQAFEIARSIFEKAKEQGRIDEFNNIIQEVH